MAKNTNYIISEEKNEKNLEKLIKKSNVIVKASGTIITLASLISVADITIGDGLIASHLGVMIVAVGCLLGTAKLKKNYEKELENLKQTKEKPTSFIKERLEVLKLQLENLKIHRAMAYTVIGGFGLSSISHIIELVTSQNSPRMLKNILASAIGTLMIIANSSDIISYNKQIKMNQEETEIFTMMSEIEEINQKKALTKDNNNKTKQ